MHHYFYILISSFFLSMYCSAKTYAEETQERLEKLKPEKTSAQAFYERLQALLANSEQNHATETQQNVVNQVPENNQNEASSATHAYNPAILQDITNSLLPLTINTNIGKILAQDSTQLSFDEQLDNMHTIAAFLTKLHLKIEALTPEAHNYLKSEEFAQHTLAKKLLGVMLAVQSLFDERLETYKSIKPQSAIVKELKKVVTQQKKLITTLLKDYFNCI
jgi:hypothetical protein